MNATTDREQTLEQIKRWDRGGLIDIEAGRGIRAVAFLLAELERVDAERDEAWKVAARQREGLRLKEAALQRERQRAAELEPLVVAALEQIRAALVRYAALAASEPEPRTAREGAE